MDKIQVTNNPGRKTIVEEYKDGKLVKRTIIEDFAPPTMIGDSPFRPTPPGDRIGDDPSQWPHPYEIRWGGQTAQIN